MSDSNGLLVVISGPSGVGKSTIAHAIEKRLDAVFSVSMTTRPKTPKETEGVDYFFVTEPAFARAIDNGDLLEHARVFDHYYGTPRRFVEEQIAAGRIVVLEIDIEGGIQVRANHPDAFMLFILPPSKDDLLNRLRQRGRESEEKIQRRYQEHEREVKRAKDTGAYDEFVINDDLDATIEKVIGLIEARRKA